MNPDLECTSVVYKFYEYLDNEYRETDILIRQNEVVKKIGRESGNVKFRKVPATKVLSIFHKSAYELLGEAYAYIVKYAKGNKYGGMEPYGSQEAFCSHWLH